MNAMLHRDPGLWLMLHLRPRATARGIGRVTARCAGATRASSATAGCSRPSSPAHGPRGSSTARASSARHVARAPACGASATPSSPSTARVERPSQTWSRRMPSARCASPSSTRSGACTRCCERLPDLTYAEYPEEDVMALSYADASFDLVLTSDTLEHVEDPMKGMEEIRRVLRPGGRHVFTVPIKPDLATSRSRERSGARVPRPWRRAVLARDPQGGHARPHRLRHRSSRVARPGRIRLRGLRLRDRLRLRRSGRSRRVRRRRRPRRASSHTSARVDAPAARG